MLDLQDNWDGEGSPAYVLSAWRRATDFVSGIITQFWEKEGKEATPPRILPGPDGSIDLDWRIGDRELLINLPLDVSESVTFFGDVKGCHPIKGELDLGVPNVWLLAWLTE